MITNLRDILYFDFDKAASLISQIEGGLAQQRTQSKEETRSTSSTRKYDLLKIFQADFGGIESDKRSILETKVLHHDLLLRLEETLFAERFAMDVNDTSAANGFGPIRAQIAQSAYVRAEGWCAIEDFNRIYEITKHFNDLRVFVYRSTLRSKYSVDQKHEQLKQLESAQRADPKDYKQLGVELKEIEKRITRELEAEKLPEWLFQGIRLWIDTLAKHRLNIRLVPFTQFPEFQIIANLKRDCFVDEDLEHLLYGYGSQPNRKLSVFGLVTSVPEREGEDAFSVYGTDSPISERQASESEAKSDRERVGGFEKAFRALFPAIQGMEKFTTYHHYPRVVIHPIAVYRNLKTPR